MHGARVLRELLDLLKRYDEPVRELAPCREYIYDMRRRVILIYSASDRVIGDGICQLPIFIST